MSRTIAGARNEQRDVSHRRSPRLGLFEGRDPFAPLPLAPTLRIDTTQLPPGEAAAQIVRHYGLPLIDDGQGMSSC